jgi:hypothetical protein
VLFSINVQVLKLKIFFLSQVLQHGVVLFFLPFFSLFVYDLHGAVFHFNHELLFPNLFMLINPVAFEGCNSVGHLNLAVDVFAMYDCCIRIGTRVPSTVIIVTFNKLVARGTSG